MPHLPGIGFLAYVAREQRRHKPNEHQLTSRDMKPESVEITDEWITAGMSDRGGWSKAQLAILGVAWPPVTGWKQRVKGRLIPQAEAERFVALRNSTGKAGA
jgi:hypothetical protein